MLVLENDGAGDRTVTGNGGASQSFAFTGALRMSYAITVRAAELADVRRDGGRLRLDSPVSIASVQIVCPSTA